MRTMLVTTALAFGMVTAAHADITVESVGIAAVKPDAACVTLSVSQRGVDAPKLQANLRQRAQDLAGRISKLQGIRRCDVKTAGVFLDRLSTLDGAAPAPKVFRGEWLVFVQAAPEEKVALNVVARALESGGELGAESFHQFGESFVAYGVTKADQAYSEALADALTKARMMAKGVADQTGLKLGAVKTVEQDPRFDESPWAGYGVSSPLLFAGPSPENVEVSFRFKITFETK